MTSMLNTNNLKKSEYFSYSKVTVTTQVPNQNDQVMHGTPFHRHHLSLVSQYDKYWSFVNVESFWSNVVLFWSGITYVIVNRDKFDQ